LTLLDYILTINREMSQYRLTTSFCAENVVFQNVIKGPV